MAPARRSVVVMTISEPPALPRMTELALGVGVGVGVADDAAVSAAGQRQLINKNKKAMESSFFIFNSFLGYVFCKYRIDNRCTLLKEYVLLR